MISKNKTKLIKSLEQKKKRRELGMFVVEGFKSVGEFVKEGFNIYFVAATSEWIGGNRHIVSRLQPEQLAELTEDELRSVSYLQHPQQVLAVFMLPPMTECPDKGWLRGNLCLALDGVQDPGNLGTIIRIADWFGIEHVVCSHECADVYSPKVVQATMGSLARIRISYTDLRAFIGGVQEEVPVYGTLLEGENIYSQELTDNGIIVMGNEGNGISPEIRAMITRGVLIPNFPSGRSTAESLNVAVATAVVCAEFRRRTSFCS